MMRKILIVDDTAFMRFVMKGIIEEIGEFEVVEAKNGMEAITAYQQHKPVLVTMDITMPEMDGITAVRNIKAVDPQARIIICSAMGQQAMVVDAIKAGARGFLVKPFDREAVIRSIVNMLQE
ncbi:response regulator [Paenibacillus puldeungensis]|uniref:Response regulator n=1 Tax=Paenibacillus puldeungensis TaxID=696536 RepID=A0ABW3RSW9_9BACL